MLRDQRGRVGLLLAAGLGLASPVLLAHGEDPRFHVPLPVDAPQVTRTLALGRNLGLRAPPTAGTRKVGEDECGVAGLFGFDVADDFAFDIDETVELEIVLGTGGPQRMLVSHDRNGAVGAQLEVAIPAATGPRSRVRVELERARFANRGTLGTDLAVGAVWGEGELTICELALRREAGSQPPAVATGELSLRLTEGEAAEPTAARIGLYDSSGRSPLPSDAAVPLEHFYDRVRMVPVRAGSLWPAENRWVFYVDGRYEAELPVGRYDLVVSKGLEYRIARRSVEVVAGGRSEVVVRLERWADLPARGWWTGDPHIHVERRESRNPAILAQMAGEDLHVANLLQIGNVRRTWFEQYAWGEEGRYRVGTRALVSGQEDPTTGHRGHTTSLNLRRPVRDLERYFLYHEAFDEARRQGGLSGYAHLSAGWFHILRGLALDVPHGDVDFVEVLQIGLCDTEVWYPFLDLGFEMVPSAGSDYPYVDLPGTVRNYVRIDGEFSPQKWFDGLEAGRTYVTNGPLLELEVDGGGDSHGMGETLDVAAGTTLRVRAAARINPDLDRLARLELVVHGEVAAVAESAEGSESLELEHELTVDEGLWLAVRAVGHFSEQWNQVVAHSAPVYVRVDGGRWWNRSRVEAIVGAQLEQLDDLESSALDPLDDLMHWDTREATLERWTRQRPLVLERIEATRALYARLLRLLGDDPAPATTAGR